MNKKLIIVHRHLIFQYKNRWFIFIIHFSWVNRFCCSARQFSSENSIRKLTKIVFFLNTLLLYSVCCLQHCLLFCTFVGLNNKAVNCTCTTIVKWTKITFVHKFIDFSKLWICLCLICVRNIPIKFFFILKKNYSFYDTHHTARRSRLNWN